ncbi:hypothetical protein RBSWK_03361 [Rhodopirellula baltica SWK14]|uniref:Uncharacterized protein n=1 Tax=Rhodopirellula baltica SWK14 TaxID=993516 RepID=L7CI30_RHOBT|nr:hypothetical protein RBSWK_03361 [Rhodopirellula baltica SWK14]
MTESDGSLCELCALGGKITPTTSLNQFKTDAKVEMPLGQVARWGRHISSYFLATEVTEDLVGRLPKSDDDLCELCVLCVLCVLCGKLPTKILLSQLEGKTWQLGSMDISGLPD